MMDLDSARQLLDFGARMGDGPRAEEQLRGAVAIHNILDRHGVAYLADEVGMGKTYVALGALALFRHLEPDSRVMVIAPRENIQRKWIKELRNFVRSNVRYPDLRMKALDDSPVRAPVMCRNLVHLTEELLLHADRDFFLRLSSFSMGLRDDLASLRALRDDFATHIPWVNDITIDGRAVDAKARLKNDLACAICCTMPVFDLVIVDEGHNLKHGRDSSASRNQVLSRVFGCSPETPNRRLFRNYAPRARRVLFLSATPVEDTYRHLWNQLDVFDKSAAFPELRSDELHSRSDQREAVSRFLVRRVTRIPVGNGHLTKNMYRREWRHGGLESHDDPIHLNDVRQRLIVALMQKKVSELLGHPKFNASFQIGMLASFESFLETAKVKRDDQANFDDSADVVDPLTREGLDVDAVNRIAADYRRRFGLELPHPKMDAVVESLADAWATGRKALVFVRRVASARELKQKLDERYDAWLIERLRRELPPEVLPRFETVVARYRQEHERAMRRRSARQQDPIVMDDPGTVAEPEEDVSAVEDRGGYDTFFAWFFRGAGPKVDVRGKKRDMVISGASIQQRLSSRSGSYSTFFERNYAAEVLSVRPGEVLDRLADVLQTTSEMLQAKLRQVGARFLSRAKKHGKGDRFEAAQGAAIFMLAHCDIPLREEASIVWHERFASAVRSPCTDSPPELASYLEVPTFWSELLARGDLCEVLWPATREDSPRSAFRDRERRAQLISSAARLGHGYIDLYVRMIHRIGSLEPRAQEEGESSSADRDRIDDYLDALEAQRATPLEQRSWGSFDELSAIAAHADLILDVNAPEILDRPLDATRAHFSALLKEQQPIGSMSQQLNRTLVQQFRMPGYPLVLVTTDLLQEGEDLHTFCSAVKHYGISWTPSAMEQRIGRIDRVRSQTERRLLPLRRALAGEDKLQVFFPHLQDTVEVLQVRRVLHRMNDFIRLMHEGLEQPAGGGRTLNVSQALLEDEKLPEPIHTPLQSAFDVTADMVTTRRKPSMVGPELARSIRRRFERLHGKALPGVSIQWDSGTGDVLLGELKVGERWQPFALRLQSLSDRPLVRCESPLGGVDPRTFAVAIRQAAAANHARVGAIVDRVGEGYTVTVEDDLLLADEKHDLVRVGLLIRRIGQQADALEQTLSPDRDARLHEFRDDLLQGAAHET